ncbi:MAG: phosphoribosylaminoimidazolesuccinocarboxamide synthase, partial [Elusimicrobia bacterium]|nr:phosphoribosylaminoimidazolesuccinocarboxamide synthase [Elusimicrobiota bacterium]
MELKKIYSGKTKDIYKKPDGNLIIYFKDDVTGENGVVDPGANSVMGKIQGKGKKSLEITNYFFNLLKKENIPTHLISVDIDKNTMEVKEAVM